MKSDYENNVILQILLTFSYFSSRTDEYVSKLSNLHLLTALWVFNHFKTIFTIENK